MLTKNGNCFFGKNTPTSANAWILTNGQTLAGNNGVSPSAINNVNNFYIIVGSSNIEPSVDDYYLKDAKALTKISSTRTNPDSNSDFMINVQTVLKNETNETIVVKEVGLIGTGYNSWTFLLLREVLPEPIIIQPNKKYLFNMTI